jgi:aerobic-type carbon monoxide dehydrogenase small subunit (CoxS/CutS family)
MSSSIPISLNVNGRSHSLRIDPSRTLLDVLRKDLGLLGTKENCQEGECGACTVLVDGKAVNSCLLLAVRAQGTEITTIEGLESGDGLHPVQQAFMDAGAIQCGYCTPGFIMSTIDLLSVQQSPTDAEIDQALSGNICRCTGYSKIRSAVHAAAKKGASS